MVAAGFAAAVAGGENLARIEVVRRAERAPQTLHRGHIVLAENPGQIVALLVAHAVLAGDRAARVDADPHDLPARLQHPRRRARLALVEQQAGVQISVPRVEHVRHRQAVAIGDLVDRVQHIGQLCARHHAVEQVVVGHNLAQRADRALAPGPEPLALLGIRRRANLARLEPPQNRLDDPALRRDLRLRPVHLDQQHRLRVEREAGLQHGFDRGDRRLVDHFQRRRHHARGDHRAHRVARLAHRVVDRQQRAHRGRRGHQPHQRLRHDPHRALAADHAADQVVARLIARRVADSLHLAIGRDQHQLEHVVGRGAPGERVRPARVLRDVAADCAGPLAARIRRVGQPVGRGRRAQIQIDHARLHPRRLILRVDLQNPPHPIHPEDHAALGRQRPAAQPRAGAARRDRRVAPIANPHQRDHILGRRRQRDRFRLAAVDRRVVLVDQQVLGTPDDRVVAQHLDQFLHQRGRLRHRTSLSQAIIAPPAALTIAPSADRENRAPPR